MGVSIMADTQDGLQVAWKPGYKACPHLSFDGMLASCAVHDRPEYLGCPCWVYGNGSVDPDFAHRRGRPCRVGEMFLKDGGYLNLRPEAAEPTPVEVLETIGPWVSSYPQDE